MTRFSFLILSAFALDLILGDPEWFTHPVKGMGYLIKKFENPLRKFIKIDKLAGFVLSLSIIFISGFSAYFILYLASANEVIYFIISVIILWTTISIRSLFDAGKKIYNLLSQRKINNARKELSMIVSRDTADLDEDSIARGTIETIAENISDGIIAPLFYAFLGGPVLAIIYKAINTLDSMIGYKNDLYLNFGFFAAKLDDAANFIPARISGIIIPIAALFSGMNWQNSFRIMFRDRLNNPSPNSGYPEAAMSGALEVRLGGENYYFGKPVKKPFIGDNLKKPGKEDIFYALRILVISSFVFLSAILFVIHVLRYL